MSGKSGTGRRISSSDEARSRKLTRRVTARIKRSTNDITFLASEGVLNATSETFLQELVAAKATITEIDAQLNARDQELSAIREDEARLRKNGEVLGDSPEEKELVKLYVDQLKANEARVQSLTKQQAEARATRQDQQNALDQKIREFVLTYTLG